MPTDQESVSKVATRTPYGAVPADRWERPMTHHEATERAVHARLLAQCAHGDERSFAQFYEATAARAHGLALRVLQNQALAEEVTQDAYLDAWRLCDRYDPSRGSAVTWLLTLVHRRAVDRVRAQQASMRRDEAYLRREPEPVDIDATSITALTSMEAIRVRAALATLPPAQQQAIALAYFGGLSHTEVAAALAAPLGTVKSRIRSGLRQLRSALAGSVSQPA
jgi:RNA polymerase sigma-70 factor (ECF subfamily)